MTISLGHIVSMLVVIATGSLAWGVQSATIEDVEKQVLANQDARLKMEASILDRMAERTREQRDLDVRVRMVEQQAARTDERFSMILSSLAKIEQRIAREENPR